MCYGVCVCLCARVLGGGGDGVQAGIFCIWLLPGGGGGLVYFWEHLARLYLHAAEKCGRHLLVACANHLFTK